MTARRKKPRVVELDDERDPVTRAALDLIVGHFPAPERQPVEELVSEIAEKRLGLLAAYDYHLLAAVGPEDEVLAAVTGIYLEGVNAGFINYLVVAPGHRRRGLAPLLRDTLVNALREDARRAGRDELGWVLGEVRPESPWLERLLREGAIPFDLTYYHPAPPGAARDEQLVLYRQPVGDERLDLPPELVRRILYAVWRRVYRISYPLERPAFRSMLAQLGTDIDDATAPPSTRAS